MGNSNKTFVLVLFAVISSVSLETSRAVDYEHDIKPLFAAKCTSCHGALEQESGLRLDAGELILAGGDNGPVLVQGDADDSSLIHRVTAEDVDERMPPEGEGEPLDAEQVALLSSWISKGAKFPTTETVLANPADHWAYQPLVRPAVPTIEDPLWAQPIDAFIAEQHQRLGLMPVEVADRNTLLRRLYLDLIGLPPTREQQRAFESDDSVEAWTHLVNSLLDNPHYGERWGRHWMDVWRYSDWDGFKGEVRGSQKHIWRWRDWIVRSLNADKGYDRMVLEMLAGDEVAPNDPEVLPATGFLARNYSNSNRNMWLDATVEHTAKAFLGLTINCARCHDHKFDPIPQTAYYEFRAIFEPHKLRTDQLPEQPNVKVDGLPRAYDADLSTETFLYVAGNEKHPDKEHPLSPATPAILGGQLEISPVPLTVEAYYPALLPYVAESRLAEARSELEAAKKKLAAVTAEKKTADEKKEASSEKSDSKPTDVRLLELRETAAQLGLQSLEARQAADRAKYGVGETANEASAADLALTAAHAERRHQAHQAVVIVREKELALKTAEGSDEKDAKKREQAVVKAKKELEEAWKKLTEAQNGLAKVDDKYTPVGKEYPHTSSGRRLALARWITSAKNPLTARVAVNHIWLRHFGAPLVENVFDFGLRSPRPRHADLLDWLAVELIENDWSMKHLHRLIVSSRTWQLASSAGNEVAKNLQIDRDNNFLWRMNLRRLEAEIVRDSVLAVSEQIDPTLGGVVIDYQQGEVSRRRSIYLRNAYEKQMTMLVQFDMASPNECYRRSESIIPQQALALINSSMSLDKSRLLAKQLWEEVGSEENTQPMFVRAAFRQILSRAPAEEEALMCLEFLENQAGNFSENETLTKFKGGEEAAVKPANDPNQRAREDLVHVLMNHNDFVTVR